MDDNVQYAVFMAEATQQRALFYPFVASLSFFSFFLAAILLYYYIYFLGSVKLKEARRLRLVGCVTMTIARVTSEIYLCMVVRGSNVTMTWLNAPTIARGKHVSRFAHSNRNTEAESV